MPRLAPVARSVPCVMAVAVGPLSGCVAPLASFEADIEREITTVPTGTTGPAPTAMTVGRPPRSDIDADASLDDSVSYALANSRTVAAAHGRWRAAMERTTRATALPDPRINYGVYVQEVETRVGPQEQRIGASQSMPWFGTLELRGDMAAAEADRRLAELQETTLDIIHRVERAYCELYYLRGAIAVTRENVSLLEQFEQTALARVRVATGSYTDIVRIQVELGRFRERLAELEDRRRPLTGRFNAALDRSTDAPAPWPEDVRPADAVPDDGRLARRLARHNPRLAALDHEIERHRVAGALARLEAYPDLTFSLDYIVTGDAADPTLSDSGDDAVIAGVGFTLPIWHEKYEAGIRAALRERLATAHQREALANTLAADLEQAMFAHRDARRKITLYEQTLIPKAQESLDATLAGYENDRVTFTDLLDAERVLLELRLAAHRARADAAIAMADIDHLTGARFADVLPEPEAQP